MANLSTQYVHQFVDLYDRLGHPRPQPRRMAKLLYVLDMVEKGRSIFRASQLAGISAPTLLRIRRSDPVFNAQLEVARTKRAQRPCRWKALTPRQVKLLLHWAEAPWVRVALEKAKVSENTLNNWRQNPKFKRAWAGISATKPHWQQRPDYVPPPTNEAGRFIRCRPLPK